MNKKQKKVFLLRCCKKTIIFSHDDFAYDENMVLVCHRHSVPIEKHISWWDGLIKDDFDKIIKEYKNT